jgi:hypothetical protein
MSTNPVSVRLDAETMARVDALTPAFSTQWRPATRSDVLRGLILAALDRFEQSGSLDIAGEAQAPSPKPKAAKSGRKARVRAKPKRGA